VGHAELTAAVPARLARASGVLLLVVWLAELGALVTRIPLLSGIAMIGLAFFLMLALLRASRHIRILFVSVTGVAVAIAAALADAGVLLRGFERAQIFGAFFPSVLLLRATVESSPRLDSLRKGVGGLNPLEACTWTLYGAHALGAVLNVGALAILAPVVTHGVSDDERIALASSGARGIATAILWSPFFVAMAFSSQLVPAATLWKTMLLGLGLAIIGLALSWLVYTRELRPSQFLRSVHELRRLLGPTAVLVGAVVACNVLFGFSGLQAVALALPLLCGIYLVVRGPAVAAAASRRAMVSFSRLSDELLIVAGAMVLGVAIGSLPQVQAFTADVTPGVVSGAPLLIVMVVALVGLGQFGLHPMIGVSVLLPVIGAGSFGIAPSVLVAAAVFSWGLSASVSVWTLPVAVSATTFGIPVRALWTRRAALFAVLLGASGLTYLVVVNAVLTGLTVTTATVTR
jgi:hypothetical protein